MLNNKRFHPPSIVMVASIFCLAVPVVAEMSLEQALDVIRKSETVDDEAVGYGAEKTETYDAFVALEKTATQEQIIGFTADKNANIRAYASMALRSRFPKENFFDLLMTHLKDENTIDYSFGCLVRKIRIGDFYFEQFSENLSDEQHSAVVEYLLTNDNNLETTSIILENEELPETLLPLIRGLATKGNASALVALAKFKREEDYPLIINAAEAGPIKCFQCIAINPQPVFFGVLQEADPALLAEDCGSETLKEFYKSVAAFKDDAALELLLKPLDGNDKAIPMREYHLDFIFEAISSYQDSVYDELKWRLWTEFDRINLTGFNHLLKLDKERAIKQTRRTLDRSSLDVESDVLPGVSTQDSEKALLPTMFDLMKKTDPTFVEKVVTRELEKCDVDNYSYFAEMAGKSKMECYVPALFKGVESADNPHVFLDATEALFAYGSEAINKRILEAPAQNPELEKGWGGEAFKNLLKNKGQPEMPDELRVPE